MDQERRSLRIVMVTELYPPSVGGQQTRFEALAMALTDLGDHVTVLCIRDNPRTKAREVLGGVTVIRSPNITNYQRPWIKATERSIHGMVAFALFVRRELKRSNCDVVYFNQWPYLQVFLADRLTRRRSAIDWCEFRSGPIHWFPQKFLPKLVSRNLTVNEESGRSITRLSGVPVGYLPSGINLSHYLARPPNDREDFLFVGRLVANKNLALLVLGFVELVRRGIKGHLRIAGDGPELEFLINFVAGIPKDVSSRIEILGLIDNETKYELLSRSRALLIPSIREGFPNVVAEAMASHLPVVTVSSPLNGTAQVVEHYGIGVVGTPDAVGFADAVERTLSNYENYVSACQNRAFELDWTVLAKTLHRELEMIASSAESSDT